MRRVLPPRLALWALAFLAACDCGADVVVEGPHPYVRCVAVDAEDQSLESPWSGQLEDRVLTLGGVQEGEVFAVSGASAGWLSEADPVPLQIVLGGFARDTVTARAILPLLAARGPALLLPGGEDDTEVLDDALDDLPAEVRDGLVDLRGVRRVQIGVHGFVVVPGAPRGRYARGDHACGYDSEDLELLEDVAEAGLGLLSWAAPLRAGIDPLDIGLLAQHAGDPMLAELAASEELVGGLHAWPREAAGAPSGGDALDAVVPVVGSLTVDAAGGRRLGTPVRVSFGADGVRRVDRPQPE